MEKSVPASKRWKEGAGHLSKKRKVTHSQARRLEAREGKVKHHSLTAANEQEGWVRPG